MILKNKKAEFGMKLFGFFFVLMIVSGLVMFLGVGLHLILYDYGFDPIITMVNDSTLDISTNAANAINTNTQTYLGFTEWIDYFFGVVLLSSFVAGIISSIKARQYGLISFFGMITIGNLFLIFLLSIAINIRGWFLNNFVYSMLLINVEMPILTFFFNYSYQIVIIMFLTFLAVNQLDLNKIRENLPDFFNKDKEDSEGQFKLGGGKFEE